MPKRHEARQVNGVFAAAERRRARPAAYQAERLDLLGLGAGRQPCRSTGTRRPARITGPCAPNRPCPRARPAALPPPAGPRPAGPGTGSAQRRGACIPPIRSQATWAGVRSRGSNTEHRRSTRSMRSCRQTAHPGAAASRDTQRPRAGRRDPGHRPPPPRQPGEQDIRTPSPRPRRRRRPRCAPPETDPAGPRAESAKSERADANCATSQP